MLRKLVKPGRCGFGVLTKISRHGPRKPEIAFKFEGTTT